METKRVTLTLPTNVYEELLEARGEETRSVTDFVRTAVLEKLARMRW
jgi:metal-responsive CopG/Arc/MetJ family transcriptional regulator